MLIDKQKQQRHKKDRAYIHEHTECTRPTLRARDYT